MRAQNWQVYLIDSLGEMGYLTCMASLRLTLTPSKYL